MSITFLKNLTCKYRKDKNKILTITKLNSSKVSPVVMVICEDFEILTYDFCNTYIMVLNTLKVLVRSGSQS